MKLSDRVSGISPSMTLVITDKAQQMKAAGIDVISFSAGEPDFPTPDGIKQEAIHWIEKDFTKYTASNGIPELKQAICRKLLEENGIEYQPSQIIVGNGAKQLLFEACGAILNPGDEVIIPTPCWVSYIEQVRFFGGVPILPATDEDNNFRLTADIIENCISEKTKAIIVNSPNNPSGAVIDPDELKKIADIAVNNNIFVISDEVYEKLNYSDIPAVSIASFGREIRDLTIIVNSFSKSYCMTGWRVGYCAAALDVIKGMSALHGHVTGNVSSFSQKAAAFAMGDLKDFSQMSSAYRERRDYMCERLNGMPGIRCNVPDGAFYVFPNVEGLYGLNTGSKMISSAADVAEYLLEKAQIACVTGEAFGMSGHIRLVFAIAPDRIREGMDRMEKALSCLSA